MEANACVEVVKKFSLPLLGGSAGGVTKLP
jgi:hypothetical protein